MLVTQAIVVVSDQQDFVDSVVDALTDEGAVVVCIEEIEALDDPLRAGFEPDAFLVDGALPDVPTIAAAIHRLPGLATTPVVTTNATESPPTTGVPSVRRDVRDIVLALDEACVLAAQ